MPLSGTNLERAGDYNQRITLQAIRVSGAVTCAELAQITGLTPPAIANITRRLLKARLIKDGGRRLGARGQPAMRFVINADSWFSIGLNIDRDHLTVVVLDFEGRVRARSSREVSFALPDAVRSYFRRAIGPLLDKARVEVRQLVGIGVAFPDDIQRVDLPDRPPGYERWGSVTVESLLSRTLPVPILVENDAAAAAIGEMHFGAGRRYQSFFYILITAGLGGGLVIDNHYFRGANGRSGELGFLHVRDSQGESRQLQQIVSLSALYGRLAARGYRVASPLGLTRLDAVGTLLIDEWIEESCAALTDTLLSINCLINPEAILIGGRLPAKIVDRLAARMNQRLQEQGQTIPPIVSVRRAVLSDDAPAVGAAIMAFSRLLPSRLALTKGSEVSNHRGLRDTA